jgi:hypothetical protein
MKSPVKVSRCLSLVQVELYEIISLPRIYKSASEKENAMQCNALHSFSSAELPVQLFTQDNAKYERRYSKKDLPAL